jgi:hypothetical protein
MRSRFWNSVLRLRAQGRAILQAGVRRSGEMQGTCGCEGEGEILGVLSALTNMRRSSASNTACACASRSARMKCLMIVRGWLQRQTPAQHHTSTRAAAMPSPLRHASSIIVSHALTTQFPPPTAQ